MPHPSSTGTLVETSFVHPPLLSSIGGHKLALRKHLTAEEKLPDNFRYEPEHLTPERDQGACGSCWAFALSSVLADIIKIKGGPNVPLSVQNLLNCHKSAGCGGADIDEAVKDIPPEAFIPESSAPYTAHEGTFKPDKCINTVNGYHVTHNKTTTYQIDGTGQELIRNMKAHIFHDGPIIGAMLEVFPDFTNYDGTSIYTPASKQTSEGGHAIEILGWGKNEEGVEYWICRNSWGDSWPANHIPGNGKGWFYIKLGVNACRIEESAYAIIPDPINKDKAQSVSEDDTYSPSVVNPPTPVIAPPANFSPEVPPEIRPNPADVKQIDNKHYIFWILLFLVIVCCVYKFSKNN